MEKYVNIIDNGVVFSKSGNVMGYSAWPSVTRDGEGNLAAVFSGNRIMHVCPFGKVLMVKSKDEGNTWSSPIIAVDTPLDDRDAGILNLGNGRLAVSTFTNTRQEQKDWANGGKYGPEVLRNLVLAYLPTLNDEQEERYVGSLLSVSDDNGFSWSEPYKVPVTSPHGPCLLNDGSLLYAGIPYHSEIPAAPGCPVAVYKSTDYRRFEKLADISACPDYTNVQYSEVHAVQLPGGRIVALIRVDELGKPYEERIFTTCQSVSDDGGKTWSVPKGSGSLGAPAHLFCHSSGTLIAVYGKRTPPYGIQAMFSTDGAETWDIGYYLWDHGLNADIGYPATTELENGDLFTVYYAKKPGENQCSILWTRWRLPKN